MCAFASRAQSDGQILQEARLQVHLHTDTEMHRNGAAGRVHVGRRLDAGLHLAERWHPVEELAAGAGDSRADAAVSGRRAAAEDQLGAEAGQAAVEGGWR